MDVTRGIRQYQETSVRSVGPEKMVVLLCEGIIRNLNRARAAMDAGDVPERNRLVNNAQAIISELRRSLDPGYDPAFAERLDSLYAYMFRENLQALIDGDAAHLENSLRVLQPLYEAWKKVPAGTAARARAQRDSEADSGPQLAGREDESRTVSPAEAEDEADRKISLTV